MNSQHNLCNLLNPALEIAISAGGVILDIYGRRFEINEKSDQTPVTEADLAASELIVSELQRLTPDIPVISEESQLPAYKERKQWQRFWLVDPLDGTREFIDHTGEFTINIALIEGDSPVLGIIYAPVLGTYYYACRNEGAYKREGTQQPQQLKVRNWQDGKVILACGRSRCGVILQQLMQRLPEYEVITLGSALKSCLVAEGKADLYARFGPTSEWDTAAAQILLEEAGGSITDLSLMPLRYNCQEGVLNPHFIACGQGLDISKLITPEGQ